MSSILKALRKLEEEKAARRDGSVDIARDILRLPRRRQVAPWRLPVAVAAAVTVLGLGGFALVGRLVESSPPATISHPDPGLPPAAVPAITTPRPSTPPALSEGVVQEVLPAEVPTRFPIAVAAVPPAPPPAESAEPGGGVREAAAAAAAGDRSSAASGAPAAVAPSIPAAPASAPPPSALPADAPSLVVTGIVFHPDPEARMAVINGLPVMPGTVMEGVRVEEILPDRVRFSRAGDDFEIPVEP